MSLQALQGIFPRRLHFGNKVKMLIFFLLLAGLAYSIITERNPISDLKIQVEQWVPNLLNLASPSQLAKPEIRVVQRTSTTIQFEWDEVAGAQAYQYRYAVAAGGHSEWKKLSSLGLRIVSLNSGERIEIEFRASNGTKHSEISAISARTLPAPTEMVALLAPASATATPSFAPDSTITPSPSATASATATASFTPELTSTSSATATSSPTGTATSQIMEVATTGDSGANARACPQFNCRIRASLRPGTAIQALGQVPGDNLGGNSTWIEFEHNGAMAYMHSSLLKAQ